MQQNERLKEHKLNLLWKCQTKMSTWQDTRLVCLKGLHYEEQRLSVSLSVKPSVVLVRFQQIGHTVSNPLVVFHSCSLDNCTQLLCRNMCWTQMAKQLPKLALFSHRVSYTGQERLIKGWTFEILYNWDNYLSAPIRC